MHVIMNSGVTGGKFCLFQVVFIKEPLIGYDVVVSDVMDKIMTVVMGAPSKSHCVCACVHVCVEL